MGSAQIPATLAEQQIRKVKGVVERLEHYVDRRVAHHDRRDLARPIPKFSELTDALEALEGVVILYWRLLKGASMGTILPTILYDWKDVFRFAWEPLICGSLNGMIEGMLHILGVGQGNLLVVFTSVDGTGSHPVADRGAAEHFIAKTLGCNLKPGDMDLLMGVVEKNGQTGIKATISSKQYKDYFST